MAAIPKAESKGAPLSSLSEKSKTHAPCSLPPCLVLEVLHNLDPIQGKSKQNLTLVCRHWAHLIVDGITVLTKKYTVAEAWDYIIGTCDDKVNKLFLQNRKQLIDQFEKKGMEGYGPLKGIRDCIIQQMADHKSFLIQELTKRKGTIIDLDSSIESLTSLICEEEERIWAKYGSKLSEKAKAYSKEIDLFQRKILFHFENYQALLTLANDLQDKMRRIQDLIIDVSDHLHNRGS